MNWIASVRTISILIVVALLAGLPGQAQTIMYVDVDASAPGDGTSWSSAYPALQDAFDEAAQNPNTDYEIWVAEGTYYPDTDNLANDGSNDGSQSSDHTDGARTESFTLRRDDVAVYGGFAGGESSRSARDPDANVVTLSGDVDGGGEDDSFHVLHFDGTGSANLTLDTILNGVTITEGNADGTFPDSYGGALFCEGSGSGNECSPLIRKATFLDNTAENCGAVFIEADTLGRASPVLSDVRFEDNAAESDASFGGAMCNFASQGGRAAPSIEVGEFISNTAGFGGAIWNYSEVDGTEDDSSEANPSIFKTTFSQNDATRRGGAIDNTGTAGGKAIVEIFRSDFMSNEADSAGGAINNTAFHTDGNGDRGTAELGIENTTFSDNAAVASGGTFGDGGAISNSSDASDDTRAGGRAEVETVNTLFAGNSATGDGGAIDNENVAGVGDSTLLTLVNTTFSGNTADADGGAISNVSPVNNYTNEIRITNGILWGDSAAGAGGEVHNSGPSAELIVDYSIVENGEGGIVDQNGASTTYDAGSNLDQNPQFAGENSGAGPDGTFGTDDDDFRLQGPGSSGGASPAIDAGDNTATSVSSDLAGNTRKMDVTGVSNTGNTPSGDPPIDRGPYESTGDALPVELTELSARVNESDVVLHWRTASEQGNAGFAVQRRNAGSKSWTRLGFVDGNGTTSEPHTYQFTDATLPYAADTLTYRLKQVNTDGTTSLSEPVRVQRNEPGAVRLLKPFPNPAHSQATVRFAVPTAQQLWLAVYDVLGRRVAVVVDDQKEAGRHSVQFDVRGLSSGPYVIRMRTGKTLKSRRLVVVQ